MRETYRHSNEVKHVVPWNNSFKLTCGELILLLIGLILKKSIQKHKTKEFSVSTDSPALLTINLMLIIHTY